MDRAKIRLTPRALIARKMEGKESATGASLIRLMKAHNEIGAPTKLTNSVYACHGIFESSFIRQRALDYVHGRIRPLFQLEASIVI